jgi:putative ABC transport system permease protein
MRENFKFRIALRNTRRHWRRSLAAILSITSGFVALNLFEGYIADAENLFDVTYSERQMYGHGFIHHKDAFQNGWWDDGMNRVTKTQQAEVESILESSGLVENKVRFLGISGMATNGKANAVFAGLGYDIEAGERMRQPSWKWNTLAGHPHDGSPDSVIIGKRLGQILDCQADPGFKVMQSKGGYKAEERPFQCLTKTLQLMTTSAAGQINATNLEIVGMIDAIFTELDVRYASMPLAKAQTLAGTDGITFYSVRFKEGLDVESSMARLQAEFEKARLPMIAVQWKDHPFGDIYVRSLAFLHVFRYFTIAVVLAIVALSVVSTLMRLVQERTREIATLKSVGFRKSQILSMFILEGGLLASIGLVIGTLLSLIVAYVFDVVVIYYKIGILSEDVPFHILLPVSNFVLSAILLLALALIGTLIAARRAINLPITEGLAHR